MISTLTARLAKTPKCRTACDLLVSLPRPPDVRATLDTQPQFSPKSLQRGGIEEALQSAALWKSIAALSFRNRNGWQALSRGSPITRDAWLEAAALPEVERFVVRRGAGTDALNVLFVPAYQLSTLSARLAPSPLEDSTNEKIGGVPAYGYCLYSGPGRLALRRFLDSSLASRRLLQKMGASDPIRAIGHAVFHVEGSLCSKPLEIYLSKEIRARSQLTSLAYAGIDARRVPELHEHVSKALPVLNIARKFIARSAGWR